MTRPPAIRLEPARVAAHRLGGQHLTAASAAPDPETIARSLVGVQAQVLSSAALSVSIRTRRLGVDAVPRALADRLLVRSWAMRGTLHAFAADDLPTVVAALRRREMWRRPAWLRYFGMTEAEMQGTIEAIGEILDDGRPRTRQELADEIGRRLGPHVGRHITGSWGSILKLAADRGWLCHATGEGSRVTFTRPDRWLGTWRDEDPDGATIALVRRFLGAYGPATLTDIRLWWGTQPTMVRPALESLRADLVDIELDGRRGIALAADVDAIAATPPIRSSVRLLGPFDPLIVSGGIRDRLIPAAQLSRVSRTAGWISPTLLLDGVVGGVWTSERSGDTLRITVDPFVALSSGRLRALEREADRLAERQGLDARLVTGPVVFGAASGPAADESVS